MATYVARSNDGDTTQRSVEAVGAEVIERTPTMVLIKATKKQAAALLKTLPAGTFHPNNTIAPPTPVRPRLAPPKKRSAKIA